MLPPRLPIVPATPALHLAWHELVGACLNLPVLLLAWHWLCRVSLVHFGPLTLLPPRPAVGLSAGIVRALLPSHSSLHWFFVVVLANLSTPCAAAVLFCLPVETMPVTVSVLPCHRLPHRPSSSEEAPLPGWVLHACFAGLRCLLFVFCEHDLCLCLFKEKVLLSSVLKFPFGKVRGKSDTRLTRFSPRENQEQQWLRAVFFDENVAWLSSTFLGGKVMLPAKGMNS